MIYLIPPIFDEMCACLFHKIIPDHEPIIDFKYFKIVRMIVKLTPVSSVILAECWLSLDL